MHQPRHTATVYAEGAFGTTDAKTANGLVRRSARYRVLSVIDSTHAGNDAGEALGSRALGIPILRDVAEALEHAHKVGSGPTHFVVGLSPDGGRLDRRGIGAVAQAVEAGLEVHSGLHDFLSENSRLMELARRHGVRIHDVRLPPSRTHLHFFSGKIDSVGALKIAVLGTDSAVGKRTTAWMLVDELSAAGYAAEMIGTGQTSWLQGARYSIVLDSLVNDFVSGEIEHAIWCAWQERRPRAIVLEGQGSLLNPAYPGGLELLAAGRPDLVILQHAPGRRYYEGAAGVEVHPIARQIAAINALRSVPVVAVTVSHEGLSPEQARIACARITSSLGLPSFDPLLDAAGSLLEVVESYLLEVD